MDDEPINPEVEDAHAIAQGIDDMLEYLEEVDSTECVYTWRGLMKGSVEIYRFRNDTDK